MTAPAPAPNPYDGKAFFIDYFDPNAPGAGFLWPADASLPPARIRGWSLNGRYVLDPNSTGKSEDFVDGPFCGKKDVFEALGKRGEQVGTEAGTIPVWTHPDGTPWSAAECQTCPLPGGPVSGGPNAGPANPPTYKQVGDQIVPVDPAAQPATPPAPSSPVASTPTLPGDPLPADHVAVHQSVIDRAKSIAARLEAMTVVDIRAVGAELRKLFHL